LKKTKNITHHTDNFASFITGAIVIIVIGILFYSILNGKQKQTESPTTTTKETQLPTKHIVKENESLWTIAETYYKSGYNWVNLVKANAIDTPDIIAVGQILTIPDVKPIIIESGQISATSISAPVHKDVVVQEGDSLWKIAELEYGSGYQWVEIARLNVIPNPELIYPKTVLRLQ